MTTADAIQMHICPSSNALAIRDDYTLIDVIGEDAEKFLQGQVSCDVCALIPGQTSLGSANTPKGRAYGVFVITRIDNGFRIRLTSDTAEQFVERLKKYIVFFKANIEINSNLSVLSVYGNDIKDKLTDKLPESCEILSFTPFSQGLCEVWGPKTQLDKLLEAFADEHLSSEHFRALEILAGIPQLSETTIEQWVPQMLNLQALNGISFKKGCYTGQEIVARMHYLGKQKKQMACLAGASIAQPSTVIPGSKIYSPSGEMAGEVVSISQIGKQTVLLAVMSNETLTHETHFQLANKTDVVLITLPYSLD